MFLDEVSDFILIAMILEKGNDSKTLHQEKGFEVSTPKNVGVNRGDHSPANCDSNSLGSWKDSGDVNDNEDTNSLGSWKDGMDELSEPVADVEAEASTSESVSSFSAPARVKLSWADMAQEDELEEEEESEVSYQQIGDENVGAEDETLLKEVKPEMQLSREQREHIRLSYVERKKDFICLERIKGKIVNILEGLELHTHVFSAAEQKRIVQYVEELQEMGKNGQLKGKIL